MLKKILFSISSFLIFSIAFACPFDNIKFFKNIYSNKNIITVGNKNAKIAIIEIYDYGCGCCKSLATELQNLLDSDKNIKIIKMPIGALSDNSMLTSKFVIAAFLQNKFDTYDKLLLKTSNYDEPKLLELAKAANLNIKKLKKDLDSTKLNNMLLFNMHTTISIALATKSIGLPITIVASTNEPYKNEIIVGNYIDKIKKAIKEIQ